MLAELLDNRAHQRLIEYEKLPGLRQATPTNEHYSPMLYTLLARLLCEVS